MYLVIYQFVFWKTAFKQRGYVHNFLKLNKPLSLLITEKYR